MRERSKARELALQVLYAVDAGPEQDISLAIEAHFERFTETTVGGEPASPTLRGFAEELIRGVIARRPELDESLAKLSRNWRPERMAQVDRNILRLALWELKYRDDIPGRVTIDEAIELAKKFGAEEAPAFVNGLLDSALHSLDAKK